jgi:cytochrome c biogenesis protein CcmG/thiol:disulfide interchange protein DsbE
MEPQRPSKWSGIASWLGKAVVTLIVLLVAMQGVGWLRAPRLPDQAPDFELLDLAGEPVRLSSFRGRPVVVNFWATWCGPCRLEAPAFSRFADRNPGIPVLGVAADGPAARLKKAKSELGIRYTVLQGTRQVLADYSVSTFPTTVLVDEHGRVVTTHVGLMLDPQIAWMTMGLATPTP